MNLLKLRLSMIGTLVLLIAVSTLFFAVILSLLGPISIMSMLFFVLLFNVAQWLFAPYMIGAMYRAKEVSKSDSPELHSIVERLSKKLGLKMPKVMLASIPIPNAFAYGSPIAGNRIAVTAGLLDSLETEEVEAVLGHELGHLKHRDVQIMMFASVLPAVFYYLGYSMMMSSWYGGGRQREEGGGAAPLLIGIVSMAIYWILTLFVLRLSRLREYYADATSASTVEDGPRKLSEALVKIVASTGRLKRYRSGTGNLNAFKALFIEDPDSAERDQMAMAKTRMFKTDQQLVQEIISRRISTADRLIELLSTHPNIVKRLQALQSLS